MDWAEACRILGVPESTTETEIKEQYIYKAQLLHPDKNQDKPENIRRRAEAELSLVNQAYTFLSNSSNNPYKVPPKLSVEPMGIRFKDIYIGERKSTILTIRNIGGPYTSIWINNQPAPWLTVTGVKSIGSERLPLEVTLECQGFGEPGSRYTCDLPIKLENETTHAVDNATAKIELFMKAMAAETKVENKTTISAGTPTAEVPQQKIVEQPAPKNQMGFSIGAFLINLVAFAILGVVSAYFVYSLFVVDQVLFIIGTIVYTGLSVGISLNHGINVGSKSETVRLKNRT